jgi:hypothetical protein
LGGNLGRADVFVDGLNEGALKMGETMEIDVAPGQHEFIVEYRTAAGVVGVGGDEALQVAGGETKRFECGVYTLGKFYLLPLGADVSATISEGDSPDVAMPGQRDQPVPDANDEGDSPDVVAIEGLTSEVQDRKRELQEAGAPYPARGLYDLGRAYALLFDCTAESRHRTAALKYMTAALQADPDLYDPFTGPADLAPFGSLMRDSDFTAFT